jgi:hypothetical protein
MSPRKPLTRFFLRTLVWLVLLTGVWSQVGKWTSQPVSTLTHMALEFGAPYWVESVKKSPELIEVQSRLQVLVKGGVGDVIVGANPSHYAYGLPILWALLLAAGGPGRVGRLALGYVLLLPTQTFSLTLDLVKQMAMAVPGGPRVLHIDQWQLELIGLGYQLGTLVLPTVVPIAIWLVLDRAFAEKLARPSSTVERAANPTPTD